MSSDGIFLVQGNDLVVLTPQPYESEDLLQELLARFPEVLAGGAAGGGSGGAGAAPTAAGHDPDDEPARLLLVAREQGVPSVAGGAARWSTDHLFIDQDGIPVIVEVKRRADTRIRREVVGQILDYAANGVRYWSIDDLQSAVAARASSLGVTPEQHLTNTLGVTDAERFWADVADNLAVGRVRMVIVADSIPEELVRIIEFLNEQMSPAEMLGVEVRQYVGGGQRVLVPRLVGRTAAAVRNRRTASARWTADSYLAQVEAHLSPAALQAAQRLFAHADGRAARINFGTAAQPGVSIWYRLIGAVDRPVLYLQVRTGASPVWAMVAPYWRDLRDHLSPDRYEAFVQGLCQIACFAAQLHPVLANGGELSGERVDLEELAAESGAVDALLALLDSITEL